jgi:hypothetical protein
MKLIKYTLTPEGTIPEYVTDGGYLAFENNNAWPQNLDLVGVANDDAPQEGFASKEALLAYLNENNLVYKDQITEEIILNQTIVDGFWAKCHS